MPLTLDCFRRAANDVEDAESLVLELGDLARWIVRDEKLRQVAQRLNRPELSHSPTILPAYRQPGAGMLVAVSTAGDTSALRDGYLLPIHWKQSTEPHDSRLPPPLIRVADQVLTELGLADYALQLMLPGQTGPTKRLLPDVTDPMDSAFAALTAALKMLITETIPDFKAVCTGKLHNHRIGQVGYLTFKTKAVLEFPPRAAEKRFTHWFIPSGSNAEDAAKTIEEHERSSGTETKLSARAFSESGRLEQQLNPLLACSGLKPDSKSADLGTLQEFYQRLLELDPHQARDYYDSELYCQILNRGFVGGAPHDARPTHFVSVVSSPALIGLAHRLFRFNHVLILHTVPANGKLGNHVDRIDFSLQALKAKQLIDQAFQRNVFIKPFVYEPQLAGNTLWSSIKDKMQPHIAEFLHDVPPGQVMWDMTSGLRLFSHILEKSFARPGNWMLTINQQWSGHQQNRIPCTETIIAWKHGEAKLF